MKNSLKQEFYKFSYQKTPIYGFLALLVLMIYTILSGNVNKSMITQAFGAGQWLSIIMITISSTFLTMEYKNNTMITLLYKSSSKLQVYLSKILVMIIYSIFLLVTSFVFTLILKAISSGNKFLWSELYGQNTLFSGLILTLIGTFIYLLFTISLAFLLITLFKNNAAVICLGLVIAFLGASLSSVIMDNFPRLIPLMKWNPLNMIYVMNQLNKTPIFSNISHLSNWQLINGNIVYIMIFNLLGYLLFKRRRV
ncbi:ABC transporter permease [Bombilactobacillus bombi]|uniref:ABC transporter permease n=1 Tax=Bombilactobacillus bombi TaxID=1303590 RepID=A0A3R6YRJ9_9LACO|nr:ABC transporter permease [Bombilactobacillus bombi]RHW49820.1 ABC transporter permease [Bombilactobacillus bombi]